MPKIKMIKSDASVTIPIGSLYIQKLQSALVFFSQNFSTEELQKFKQLIENKEEFTDDWMEPLYTLTVLVSVLEQEIHKTGQFYEKEIDEISKE